MPIIGREKRIIYMKKIRGFWEEFHRNKIGFLGLLILSVYVVAAFGAPYLTPYRPRTQKHRPPRVATSYAAPAWATIFPQYRNLNPTVRIPLFKNAQLIDVTGPVSIDDNLQKPYMEFSADTKTNATVLLDLGNFSYTYPPPPEYTSSIPYRFEFENTEVQFDLVLRTKENSKWNTYLQDPTQAVIGRSTKYRPVDVTIKNASGHMIHLKINVSEGEFIENSETQTSINRLFAWKFKEQIHALSAAPIIFSTKGEYNLQLEITFKTIPPHKGAYARVTLEGGDLTLWGRIHGILGTNQYGHDVWTELVYGAQISLIVGLLSAIISTTLGIFFGTIAGYVGGAVDELTMRTVDILLSLPVLPILLILIRYFEPNVYYIVVLIAIFGWQGLTRIIRSKVLSLKEMPFIESGKASGASAFYIMRRHIIPNVLPIASAALVLAVPAAILAEAALSFLGFGDPNVPTWGRMLYLTREGAFGANLAWWYFLPPGLAITTLCLAFVFIGHAVDEIVNPKLRRRR